MLMLLFGNQISSLQPLGLMIVQFLHLGQMTRYREIEWEVRGCQDDLADWLGWVPKHFAFPYGLAHNIRPRVIQYLYDHGFASYCSATGGYNIPKSKAFHLKRFHGDPLGKRVPNWLSYDPRWIFANSEFEYVPFERPQSSPGTQAINS